jgi:hypothetical protein
MKDFAADFNALLPKLKSAAPQGAATNGYCPKTFITLSYES